MFVIINAILAVFLVICLGYLIRRADFVNPSVWPGIERIGYYILMPALLLNSIAKADLSDLDLLPFIGALMAAVSTMIGGLIIAKPILRLDGPQYASFFQATTRWNSFVALATIAAAYGPSAMGAAGVVFAVIVPFLNATSVIVLALNAGGPPPGPLKIAQTLSKNPLILGCLIGSVLNATQIGLPGPVGAFTEILARAALAIGLISVGAALNLRVLRSSSLHLGLACFLKLIVMPCLMLGWCLAFGISGMALTVAVAAGAVPTATASYILARQLGGDAEFMASLITATTLAAALTMPVILMLLT